MISDEEIQTALHEAVEFGEELRGDVLAQILERFQSLRSAAALIVDIHRETRFTDVSLGLIDVPVCIKCHGVLDNGADEPPIVQDPYPCSTLRALGLSEKETR